MWGELFTEVEVEVDGVSLGRFPVPALISVDVDLPSPLLAEQSVRVRPFLQVPFIPAIPLAPMSPAVKVVAFSVPGAVPVRLRVQAAIDPAQPVVIVEGAPPGYEVEVRQALGSIGVGRAGPSGTAAVEVAMAPNLAVRAWLTMPGIQLDSFDVQPQVTVVPVPTIDRAFAGQSVVVVRGLSPGARAELFVWLFGLLVPLQLVAGSTGVATFNMPVLLTAGLALRARSVDPLGLSSDIVLVEAGYTCGLPILVRRPGVPIRVDRVIRPCDRGRHVWSEASPPRHRA